MFGVASTWNVREPSIVELSGQDNRNCRFAWALLIEGDLTAKPRDFQDCPLLFGRAGLRANRSGLFGNRGFAWMRLFITSFSVDLLVDSRRQSLPIFSGLPFRTSAGTALFPAPYSQRWGCLSSHRKQ